LATFSVDLVAAVSRVAGLVRVTSLYAGRGELSVESGNWLDGYLCARSITVDLVQAATTASEPPFAFGDVAMPAGPMHFSRSV
jgi:hypothetical protein